MGNTKTIPTLEQFLAAPIEEVAKVAPATMAYGAGGTRRRAVFEGIEPWSDEFMQWARTRILSCIDLLFRHGVRNLLVTTLTPNNFREVNRYQEQLLEKAHWLIAGAESLSDYRSWGWRVRLIGAEDLPLLSNTAEYLRTMTTTNNRHTLYWHVVPTAESPWQQFLVAAQQTKAQTRAEVVCALYGDDVPPVSLYLGFGKPIIVPDVIPPWLMGHVQSYWSQQPGFTLTEAQLRTILYDYAYLRPTWRSEKLDRAKEAMPDRQAWEEGPILGLGMRLGPFWYPAPMYSSAWTSD